MESKEEILRKKQVLIDNNGYTPYVTLTSAQEAMEEYAAVNIHQLQQELDGYKEWAEDHKTLVREIDTVLHGLNAAKQASLCDLVRPIQKLVIQHAKVQQENERLKQTADQNMEEYTKILVEQTTLKSEYDKLKGENKCLKEEVNRLKGFRFG